MEQEGQGRVEGQWRQLGRVEDLLEDHARAGVGAG